MEKRLIVLFKGKMEEFIPVFHELEGLGFNANKIIEYNKLKNIKNLISKFNPYEVFFILSMSLLELTEFEFNK